MPCMCGLRIPKFRPSTEHFHLLMVAVLSEALPWKSFKVDIRDCQFAGARGRRIPPHCSGRP